MDTEPLLRGAGPGGSGAAASGAGLILALLLLAPPAARPQVGITPFMAPPVPLEGGASQFAGYATLEEEPDGFAVYRHGTGMGLDYGLRAGYSEGFGGGVHFGGDLRHGLPHHDDTFPLELALLAGFQATLASDGNVFAIPFGLAIGVAFGPTERAFQIYTLPFLAVQRDSPDEASADTDLEIGVETGVRIPLLGGLFLEGSAIVSSHREDDVTAGFGLAWIP